MTSLKRNAERERSLLPQIILRTWRDTNKNIDLYRQEFSDRFILINNDPEDANKTFDPAEVKKLYFDTAGFKGKPKTPEEQAKAKADAEQLNQDIISLVKQIPQTDTLDSAKSKIAMLAEGEQQYKLYCDMDGVIVDFERGYNDLTGKKTPGVDSTYVENWSEGCQVFKRAADFEEFMTICRKSAKIHGASFTYTLIESKDIV
jgi:hypothetical protein